jgi:DNA (cytosine-5)-methyltransferase 1
MPRTAVDLFCGSGGVTAGLKAAGWEVVAALDNDPIAASTYQENHSEVKFVKHDIEAKIALEEMREAVANRRIDLLVICAPCQPFSSQNRMKGNDPRQQLIIKSLKFVSLIQPTLVFFENVPGLAGPSHQSVLWELRTALSAVGYLVTDPLVRDASTFGVPQRRKRCIMVAAKSDAALDAFLGTDTTQPEKTVHDAIGRLRLLDSGEKHPSDTLHRARNHSELALRRLAKIPKDGGSRASLPGELELRCHKGSKAFPDVYGRMSWNTVAPTLTTGCTDVTRGRFAHPAQDRAITLREAARLQTFDDDYHFVGNSSQIATQIGNAVPPAMIAHLATAFDAALMKTSGDGGS